MELALNFSLGWSNLLTLLLGAVLVGLYHWKKMKAIEAKVDRLRSAFRNFIFDPRSNKLVDHLCDPQRIAGNEHAEADWEIIDRLAEAVMKITSPNDGPFWKAWQKKRAAIFQALQNSQNN